MEPLGQILADLAPLVVGGGLLLPLRPDPTVEFIQGLVEVQKIESRSIQPVTCAGQIPAGVVNFDIASFPPLSPQLS
ncbi:hypothetical protein P0O24_11975 [Methanotrichaceae archaeon M04Ac]|uniref:AMP-dependent synthetase/ligase domain-containing protein n=1 Tax=Candidatus Methanocrinis alkalitolerans TaxID=3033395 RepID=A0ABT5XIH6_9EURY|nr:hypothetical protein [Candidatus Methanocrinis alkalitolerans]MDF0594297.1 hypothetical protein [Candidatus Methanocrinis alkalitolerans]